jgi:hypothetical protein
MPAGHSPYNELDVQEEEVTDNRIWQPLGRPQREQKNTHGLPGVGATGDYYRVTFSAENHYYVLYVDVLPVRSAGGVLTTITIVRPSNRAETLAIDIADADYDTEDQALAAAHVEAELIYAHATFPEEF